MDISIGHGKLVLPSRERERERESERERGGDDRFLYVLVEKDRP